MDTKPTTSNNSRGGQRPSNDRNGGRGGSSFGGKKGGPGRKGGNGRGGPKKGGGERYRPEYDQKILAIRRVARVVAGGRRFSFSVAIVAGNRQGKVGVGTGKAGDTSLAIEKAFNNARKNLMTIHLTDNKSIPHQVEAKYASARVAIRPAAGRGLVSGSSVRSVLELAGITDVTTKLLSRTKNPINNARATILALEQLRAPRKSKKEAEVVETVDAPVEVAEAKQ